ncbi:MAG: response regulator [Nitrospira sp. CR1.3]|nr:response regulator [Nitrospira sp. CR1.3]
MPVNLLIAEDQRLFRQSLRLLLERERDLRVVGEATDGREAFEQAMKLKPDMVLMDVDMPKLDGVTATKLIRGCLPEVKVLMLSVHDEDARIVAAVQSGASGYILKDADHAEFLRIIRMTHQGKQVLSPFMPDRFAHGAVAAMDQAREPDHQPLAHLTEREREILSCAAAGQGNKEIADRLCVSLDTVKTHLHHIYQKLHVSGRIEAILTFLGSNKPAR